LWSWSVGETTEVSADPGAVARVDAVEDLVCAKRT
jgi:hypothetical protein